MANSELGAKQICPNCQSKFYDLGRRPAVCPKCATAFDPEEAVRNRRIRARATPPDYEADEEKPAKAAEAEVEGFEDEADETPELDEPAAAEPLETDEDVADAPAAPAEDLGVDFAEDPELEEEAEDAVPFLEDEDEDFVDEEIDGLPGEDEADH